MIERVLFVDVKIDKRYIYFSPEGLILIREP